MRHFLSRAGAVSVFVALTFTAGLAFAQIQFPELTGRVVDGANLLSNEKETQVVELLREHELETGNQVVVVTLQSLQDRTIEEFGVELGRHWGIGKANEDNGVLLIIAPNERQVRIEVGYGLEGILTDARASMIIQNEIIPAFRAGDRPKGIVDGVEEILDILADGEVAGTGYENDRGFFNLPPFAIWLGFVLLIMFIRRQGWVGSLGRSSSSGSSLSGGWSSSSSGGGGFSGGGGSFGGGGASGGW